MSADNVPADTLVFPRDLGAWRQWQAQTHRLRRLRGRVTALARGAVHRGASGNRPALHLSVRGDNPTILVSVDATTPTQIASVLQPLTGLPGHDLAIVSVTRIDDLPQGHGERGEHWQHTSVDPRAPLPEALRDIRVVMGVGNYLPAGAVAHGWSREVGARYVVVQHGLLTPFAPPLPEGAHLAAFSAEDARFYAGDRRDLTWQVTGSQLLWEASQPGQRVEPGSERGKPIFLGQLHGAELPRAEFAKAATRFCSTTGGSYRPHPGEKDRLSRAQHALWQASGITVDRSSSPLGALGSPVASVFSTGILEAAARGLPARVTHPDPPAWLQAFWDRYAMVPWNGSARGAGAADDAAPATPAPPVPDGEPAWAVSHMLSSLAANGEVHRAASNESESA